VTKRTGTALLGAVLVLGVATVVAGSVASDIVSGSNMVSYVANLVFAGLWWRIERRFGAMATKKDMKAMREDLGADMDAAGSRAIEAIGNVEERQLEAIRDVNERISEQVRRIDRLYEGQRGHR